MSSEFGYANDPLRLEIISYITSNPNSSIIDIFNGIPASHTKVRHWLQELSRSSTISPSSPIGSVPLQSITWTLGGGPVIPGSPELWVKMDNDLVGGKLRDYSGNAKHLTITGTVYNAVNPSIGTFGTRSVDGLDDMFTDDSKTVGDFEKTDAFSGLIAVNHDVQGTRTTQIYMSKSNASFLTGWQLFINAAGNVRLHLVSSGGGAILVSSVAVVSQGAFHTIGFTYDGSDTPAGITIFIDGLPVSVTVDSDTLTGNIANNGAFKIGSREFSPSGFELVADIADAFEWGEKLSNADVLSLHNELVAA